LVFCIFFIVSFLGGIIRGYYVTKQPDHLINFIKKNVFLSADKEKKYYISYTCRGPFYKYYIDDNHVERSFDESIKQSLNPRSIIDSLVGEGTVLKVILGGAAAYSFKDVVNFVIGKDDQGSTIKERISMVVVGLSSAASGYALGYWFMVASTPKCNSLDIIKLLDKPEEWSRFEREVWQSSKNIASMRLSYVIWKVGINRPDVGEVEELPLVKLLRQKMGEIEKRTANTQYDFSTEDFKSLDEIYRLTDILLQNYRSS
jgi:hypothetical protein